MTYTIEVPLEVEQVLAARAQASGVTVVKYLQDIVIREVALNSTSAPAIAVAPYDVEMDALEELAAKYPRTEPLADNAVALAYDEHDANLLLRLVEPTHHHHASATEAMTCCALRS